MSQWGLQLLLQAHYGPQSVSHFTCCLILLLLLHLILHPYPCLSIGCNLVGVLLSLWFFCWPLVTEFEQWREWALDSDLFLTSYSSSCSIVQRAAHLGSFSPFIAAPIQWQVEEPLSVPFLMSHSGGERSPSWISFSPATSLLFFWKDLSFHEH